MPCRHFGDEGQRRERVIFEFQNAWTLVQEAGKGWRENRSRGLEGERMRRDGGEY